MPFIALLLAPACAERTHVTDVGAIDVTTFRRDFANTHVVEADGGTFLVDPGSDEGAPEMDEAIRHEGFDPVDFTGVLLTHGHADHAGGALWFREAYGTPIVGGAGDEILFTTGENDTLCPTDARAERLLEDAQVQDYEPFEADQLVEATTELSTIANDLRGTQVPGHTEGSVVYTTGEIAFLGDILRGSILGSLARTHFFMCDLEDNEADVAHVLDEVAPDATMFFVGHFGPFDRDAVERWLDEPSSR